jgi:hypothetical protein
LEVDEVLYLAEVSMAHDRGAVLPLIVTTPAVLTPVGLPARRSGGTEGVRHRPRLVDEREKE